MSRIAVYAGSFDPPTKGHVWMMEQGAALFDELVVTLAVNPDKKSFMSAELRQSLLESIIKDLGGNVRLAVVSDGFLIDFAHKCNASFLLRGIRNTIDFEYERSMARMNAHMEDDIQSVFLMAPSEFEQISSTTVRGFIGVQGWERWAAECVPSVVFDCMKNLSNQSL